MQKLQNRILVLGLWAEQDGKKTFFVRTFYEASGQFMCLYLVQGILLYQRDRSAGVKERFASVVVFKPLLTEEPSSLQSLDLAIYSKLCVVALLLQ
jgi:hypothetical protein